MNNIITEVEKLRDEFNSNYALAENAYQRACDDVILLLQNLQQTDVSSSLPLLEDCKNAAKTYADKKGGSEYGLVFRSFQEGINWALNYVNCKR